MSAPDNTDDVVDSRDVIESIAELEGEIQSRILTDLFPGEDASWGDVADANVDAADGIHVLPVSLWPTGLDAATIAELGELASVLVPLRKLASQGECSTGDWQHGATLIRDSYFEDYARELADDIGAVPTERTWPMTCIDWEQAARELQMDYTSVDFDGVDYWVRS